MRQQFGPAIASARQGQSELYRMVAEGFGHDPSVISRPHAQWMEDCLYIEHLRTPQGARMKGDCPLMIWWCRRVAIVNGWAYEPNMSGGRRSSGRGCDPLGIIALGALGFLPIHLRRRPAFRRKNYWYFRHYCRDNAGVRRQMRRTFGGDQAI